VEVFYALYINFHSSFITAEVSTTGRRSFRDDMTGRFSIGTMHAVFQVVGTVFVEKHALNIMQKM